MRKQQIKTFYTPKQVLAQGRGSSNFSKSPLKPALLLSYLENHGLIQHLDIVDSFQPFTDDDFKIAHEESYISEFFGGKGRCSTNNLSWSEQFASTVRYTNASIYEAIRNSIVNPDQISFSPTSGFHHASPKHGSGFCTFSGQVIASIKLYREFGISGAYLDLDGHFGNSIEDSREFCPELNSAVPRNFNINPTGHDANYVSDLGRWLARLRHKILSGKIGYVVWCHGADSHVDDDLGSQCSTEYWTACSELFWKWVAEMDKELGRPLPVSCALFGGYRSDDYDSVLSLHTSDLVSCLNNVLDLKIDYEVRVKSVYKPRWKNWYSI